MGRQKKSKSRNKHRDLVIDKKTELNQDEDSGLYKIEESDTFGRFAYLVATRDIPSGEIVLSDEPLVVGPCQEGKPLCIGCYVDLDLNDEKTYQRVYKQEPHSSLGACFRCKNCSWPLCGSNCPGYRVEHGHNESECDLLAKSGIKEKGISLFKGFYYAVTVFRCLVLKKKNPAGWAVVTKMESHTEERKKWRDLWETNEKLGVNVIRDIWGIKEFSEEEIHFACGVLEVNAFEVNLSSPATQCLRAIYPKAFLFAHDCVPNTRRSNEQDFQVTIRAMRGIPKNEMITVNYAYTLQSTLMRRKHIKETKFFSCTCKRCSDPTEFGTYTGAIKCIACQTGFLLPENPLDENSFWKCNTSKCSNQMEVSQIIPLLDKLFKELDSIHGNNVTGYEAFIRKCSAIFHENHYLILSAMHCLSQLYGKIHGYLINDLTNEQLERKEEICRKLIKMFEKFELGQSRQRGILLYELQAPLMVLLKRRFQSLPKKELKSKIKEVLKYLGESHLILSKEPEHSVERQMAAAAEDAITNLNDWLNFLN